MTRYRLVVLNAPSPLPRRSASSICARTASVGAGTLKQSACGDRHRMLGFLVVEVSLRRAPREDDLALVAANARAEPRGELSDGSLVVPWDRGISLPSAAPIAATSTSVISSTPPPGSQTEMRIRPVGLTTRIASDTLRSASAAKITPNTDRTASNSPSRNGSACAPPTTNDPSSPSAASRSRAISSSREAGSSPVTTAPPRAASSAAIAGSAAEVEDAFTWLQVGQRDDVLGGRLDVGREALVAPGAPIGHLELLTRNGYIWIVKLL
jgi:hypothetical protein